MKQTKPSLRIRKDFKEKRTPELTIEGYSPGKRRAEAMSFNSIISKSRKSKHLGL